MSKRDLELPYYTATVDGSAYETGITITFKVDIAAGGTLAGKTRDDVADDVRDYLDGLSGAASSSLNKYEETATTL